MTMYSPCSDWSFSSRVSPFGNQRIVGYLLLPVAYRSLSRPSSAPIAKASTLRSFLLDHSACIALHAGQLLLRFVILSNNSYFDVLIFVISIGFSMQFSRNNHSGDWIIIRQIASSSLVSDLVFD